MHQPQAAEGVLRGDAPPQIEAERKETDFLAMNEYWARPAPAIPAEILAQLRDMTNPNGD
jgi:hypothetical protein